MATKYDAIVIGTGQAGPSLSVRLAATGMKVAIIERKRFGGTCVNTGCIPTKTLVASGRVQRFYRAVTTAEDENKAIRFIGPTSDLFPSRFITGAKLLHRRRYIPDARIASIAANSMVNQIFVSRGYKNL